MRNPARARRLSGCEALPRWNHPERGNVPPAEFIPLAEDTGLIGPRGRWVLCSAFTQHLGTDDKVNLIVKPIISLAHFAEA